MTDNLELPSNYPKRLFDIIVSGSVLVFLAPIIVLIAVLVRWKLGSPILFRQTRPGLHGRLFETIKFRSMLDARDQFGASLPDEHRLTRFGKLLRSTSLDELPQLVNVVRGDLSLVGPRPLLVEYLSLYTPEQSRRHLVRPGITGWAQVNGRNAIEWEKKFALDVWYVDNQSFWIDMKILALTFSKVIRRSGISAKCQPTMPPFRGSVDAPKATESLETKR